MKFLNTKETGFDTNSIGFPSVKTCQAIVYQTGAGLFGYHDSLGTTTGFTNKCIAFAQFVTAHSPNHGVSAVCLIGAITREERFKKNQQADWTAQLVEVAHYLNFAGPIWGVRLEGHVKKDDSAYIRFDTALGGQPPCRVSFKTWGKMDYDNSVTLNNNATEFGMLQPRALTNDDVRGMTYEEMSDAKANSPFDMVMPPLASHPVLRKGKTDEGTLNVAKKFVRLR